ncbi:MAG: LicD family protein [Clostridia bacterium]|nr:LicD family protein [Clostridia bacterium]
MRELSFEEIKKYELDILKEVAEFCDKNNLRYFLAFGTLIGAVRHKGFIPWDDDIDIQMPREDYNKFIQTFESENYKLVQPYDKQAKHTIAKVIDKRTLKIEKSIKYKKGEELGIDVDIFPIDGQPYEEKEFLKYFNKKHLLYKMFSYIVIDVKAYSIRGKLAFGIPILISKCIGKNLIMKRIDKISARYPYEENDYVGSTSSLYEGVENRTLKQWYDGTAEVDFEGYKFKAPVGYCEILTQLYGNYMQLPPEEQRVTHHSNHCYLKY